MSLRTRFLIARPKAKVCHKCDELATGEVRKRIRRNHQKQALDIEVTCEGCVTREKHGKDTMVKRQPIHEHGLRDDKQEHS